MHRKPEIKATQKDKAKKIIDYGLDGGEQALKADNLDQAMADYYGERVQSLRLGKISSEMDSQNQKDKEDTCSSIFSCNVFGKSSSDSPASSIQKNKEFSNMSPSEDHILMDQAPRTLAMICDVIGSDEKDQNSEMSQNKQQSKQGDDSSQISQPMLIES